MQQSRSLVVSQEKSRIDAKRQLRQLHPSSVIYQLSPLIGVILLIRSASVLITGYENIVLVAQKLFTLKVFNHFLFMHHPWRS